MANLELYLTGGLHATCLGFISNWVW